MQKFYSIVLMATALLIGTNVWAASPVASINGADNTYDNLNAVFAAAPDGAKITLDAEVKDANFGDAITIMDGRKLELDLNDHNINIAQKYMFKIFKGKLEVSGTGIIENSWGDSEWNAAGYALGAWEAATTPRKRPKNGHAFCLAGAELSSQVTAYQPTEKWYTYLIIGENVTVIGHSVGIYTDCVLNLGATTAELQALGYDNYADGIFITGTAKDPATNKTSKANAAKGTAFGVKADVYGDVSGIKYAIQVSGNCGGPVTSTDIVPEYTVSGAKAKVHTIGNELTYAAAIYGGGYAKWTIEDKAVVEGTTGLYAKSGEMVIDNAIVQSTATSYSEPVKSGSGIETASGSAIILDSNKAYQGEMDITIKGDSKITGTAGYALETVITSGNNEVNTIDIEGGTFKATGTPDKTYGVINATSAITAENAANVTIGTANLGNDDKVKELIDAAGGNHIVSQTTDEEGKPLYVITQSDSEVIRENLNINALTDAQKTIEWHNSQQTLTADGVDIHYLALSEGSSLTIKDGKTIKIGSVVLDETSSITIEPGGQLVITKTSGIVAYKKTNIVIQAKNGKMGMLMMNPDVEANKTPAATVELETKAYKKGATDSPEDKVWERIGVPAADGMKASEIVKSVTSYLQYWDDNKNQYVGISGASYMLQPFVGYSLSNDAAAPGQIYQFPCNLVGNSNGNLVIGKDWGSFSNSYTANIDAEILITMIKEAVGEGNINPVLYWYDGENDSWENTSFADYEENDPYALAKIAPMQAFLFNRLVPGAAAASATIDYKATVWEPVYPSNAGSAAPARKSVRTDLTKAVITITAENGKSDKVTLRQSMDFSADFDNGYDARKNMDLKAFNIYANTELGAMTQLADNAIEGQKLTIATENETSFKMSFSNIIGEQLAIRDNLTGAVINMVEGAEYFFTVVENSVSERFEIIGVNNAPTDVETVVANDGAKAVYTILGQYMGTTDNWNTLPTGIYVVDGVKMVK